MNMASSPKVLGAGVVRGAHVIGAGAGTGAGAGGLEGRSSVGGAERIHNDVHNPHDAGEARVSYLEISARAGLCQGRINCCC